MKRSLNLLMYHTSVIRKQNEPLNIEKTETMRSESNGKLNTFCKPAAYSIHVEGLMDESWSERFAGMKIKTNERKDLPPLTTLSGQLTDQAELLGVLNALYNLRITLMTVERLDEPSTPTRTCCWSKATP